MPPSPHTTLVHAEVLITFHMRFGQDDTTNSFACSAVQHAVLHLSLHALAGLHACSHAHHLRHGVLQVMSSPAWCTSATWPSRRASPSPSWAAASLCE